MNDTPADKPFVYDEVLYPDSLSVTSTPNRIAATLRTRGWAPPAPETASFLEIGCSTGLNSIAIAAAEPRSRTVGFDLSARAIEGGRRLVEASGLTNVDLHQGDILTYPRDGEKFDYIVTHGVYTWIPAHVRPALLELIAARLAPGGVAYIGYDALPTAGVKGAVTRWLIESTAHIADPADRVDAAVELVAVLARHQQPDSRFKLVLDNFLRDAGGYKRAYVFHDWVAEFHDPVSLPDLAKVAASHGLAFIGNANLVDFHLGDLDETATAIVAASGDDLVRRNVTLDLLRGVHSYRSDLFVRADAPPPEEPYAWRKLSFSCRRRREPDEEKGGTAVKYIEDKLVASIADPDKQKVVDLLIASAPAELGFAAIAAQTGASETRLDDFLRFGTVGQIVERHASPQPFVTAPGERPLASPIVRAHLAHDTTTVNLRHRKVDLEDGPLRLLLVLSDGTRTRSEIGAAVADTFGVDVTPASTDSVIARLAQLRVFQG